jgi:hypothetical protein
MPSHRVICTRQEPADRETHSAHSVSVGIATVPTANTRLMSLGEVWQAISYGEIFYTQGPQSDKVALVARHTCYC